MQTCDTLLHAGVLLPQDDDRRVLENAALAIDGGRIVALGYSQDVTAAWQARDILDLSGMLVMPGLVNAHTHAAMTFLRGLADDMPLMDWLQQKIFPVEQGLTPDLVRLGSLLGMIGGGLLADLLGFSTVALLFGALTLTGLPLALTRIPRSGRATGAASQAATSLLSGLHLRHPDMRRAFITGLLVALVFQGIYAATLSRMVALHVGELALAGGLVIGCATLAGTLQALRWLWEPWLAPWFGRLSDGPRGRGPVLCACLGGGACARALVALYLPAPLWLPLLLCSQLCATGLATLSAAAASGPAERHGHPTHTLASYAFIVDCGAAAGPVLAYSVQDLWGMDAAYLAAAALLLCLLPLWMRREAA